MYHSERTVIDRYFPILHFIYFYSELIYNKTIPNKIQMLVEKIVFGFFPSMSNSDSRVRSNALQSEFASAEMSLHAIYMHEVISCS